MPIFGISLNQVTPSPLNDAGQVVFRASSGFQTGLFVGSVGASPAKIVLTGDPAPGGGTFLQLSFGGAAINSNGQVAFTATVQSGGQRDGIFLGAPGSSTQKIVLQGDPGPGGTTFSGLPRSESLNDLGEVAFAALLSGGPGGGLFVGTASATPQAIALNGESAPAGGFYSGLGPNPDILINNEDDLTFRCDLVNGPSNSGYFLRRGSSVALEAVALQGQPAPGTSGTFQTMPSNLNGLLGENMLLRPNGEVAFLGIVDLGGINLLGYWRFLTDDTLEKIIVRGDPAPGSGAGILTISTLGTSTLTGGNISLFTGISGGDFTDAIYVLRDTAPGKPAK
jgi:hypothetical protein